MIPSLLWLSITLYVLSAWLGLYIVDRDPRSGLSWLAGGSVLVVAFSQLFNVLTLYAPSVRLAQQSSQALWATLLAAAFLWLGFLIRLVPSEAAWQERFQAMPKTMILMLLGTILFAIGTIWAVFPLGVSIPIVIWGLSALLLYLGTCAVSVIAADRGEAVWPDYLRSLDYTVVTAFIFGGQIGLLMWLVTGVNFFVLTLLFAVLFTAVFLQVFSSRLSNAMDRFAFLAFPKIWRARAELRAGSDAIPRIDTSLQINKLSNDEFVRLTRRALSELNNMPRLATSPLTQLPLVHLRLAEQGVPADTLARADMLKQLLIESVEQLRPDWETEFAKSEGWRHFNALYFPYVVGIRPYRRYVDPSHLAPAAQKALEWFRAEVPARTLYNWQNAAAKLVAQHLRERSNRALYAAQRDGQIV